MLQQFARRSDWSVTSIAAVEHGWSDSGRFLFISATLSDSATTSAAVVIAALCRDTLAGIVTALLVLAQLQKLRLS